MTCFALCLIVALVGRVNAGSMCCMDKTQDICARDDHPCQCASGTCDPNNPDLRDEVENLTDGRLDAAIDAYKTAQTARGTVEESRFKPFLSLCPDSTVADGIITFKGCNGATYGDLELEDQVLDTYYSCVSYNEAAKVVYNTCRNTAPNLFWSTSPGSFGMCAREGETNSCSGGELHVSMYMGQIKADGDNVLNWYKKATFANQENECGANQTGGFRWRYSLGIDRYKESCNPVQMEFEEPIKWFNATNASTVYSDDAHLGDGWSMMQIRFAEHPTDLTSSSSRFSDGRCVFSKTVGDSGITDCANNVIHPGGAKFVLELDQNKWQANYPHEATTYWDECTATRTGTEQCLQCFVVDYSAVGEGMDVSADMENKTIYATETKNGVNTMFKYRFEDIVNTVRPAGDFRPSNPDFVYDFKQAKVILEGDGDIQRAYVCLDQTDYDPTTAAGNSFQCPQHDAEDAMCETVFLYDPEMSVTVTDVDGTARDAGTANTGPTEQKVYVTMAMTFDEALNDTQKIQITDKIKTIYLTKLPASVSNVMVSIQPSRRRRRHLLEGVEYTVTITITVEATAQELTTEFDRVKSELAPEYYTGDETFQALIQADVVDTLGVTVTVSEPTVNSAGCGGISTNFDCGGSRLVPFTGIVGVLLAVRLLAL